MKLIKFLKLSNKTTAKADQQRTDFVKEVALSSNSAQAIARTVHANAWKRWDSAQYAELRREFIKAQAHQKLFTMTLKQRRELIIQVSSKVGRSPVAVVNKLKELGSIPNHTRFKF